VTLQEIEQGLKLHEERFARIDAEHEERFKRIEDNLVVQGEILNRIDQRLDRMAARVEGHDQQLTLLQSAGTSLNSAVRNLSSTVENLSSTVEAQGQQLTLMQSAMTSLFQRMDAFIQGLERGNGNTPAGGPR